MGAPALTLERVCFQCAGDGVCSYAVSGGRWNSGLGNWEPDDYEAECNACYGLGITTLTEGEAEFADFLSDLEEEVWLELDEGSTSVPAVRAQVLEAVRTHGEEEVVRVALGLPRMSREQLHG